MDPPYDINNEQQDINISRDYICRYNINNFISMIYYLHSINYKYKFREGELQYFIDQFLEKADITDPNIYNNLYIISYFLIFYNKNISNQSIIEYYLNKYLKTSTTINSLQIIELISIMLIRYDNKVTISPILARALLNKFIEYGGFNNYNLEQKQFINVLLLFVQYKISNNQFLDDMQEYIYKNYKTFNLYCYWKIIRAMAVFNDKNYKLIDFIIDKIEFCDETIDHLSLVYYFISENLMSLKYNNIRNINMFLKFYYYVDSLSERPDDKYKIYPEIKIYLKDEIKEYYYKSRHHHKNTQDASNENKDHRESQNYAPSRSEESIKYEPDHEPISSYNDPYDDPYDESFDVKRRRI